MLTLHHLENSQSIRILWLLEELEAKYEIKHYKRSGPQTLAPEEFKNLHVIGTSPIISDGELVLPETGAIIDYILDKYPNNQLRPSASSPLRTRYLYWNHATQASFMPLLLEALIFKRMVSKSPFFIRPLVSLLVNKVRDNYLWVRYRRHLSFLEQELTHSQWLAGDTLTSADIVMGYCLEVAQVRTGIGQQYPNIEAYINRFRARPAYQAALKKGGNFKPLAK